MSMRLFAAILRARWRLMSLLLLLVVAGTLAASLWMPKQYTATAAVLLDVKSPDPIAGMVIPGLMSPSYMATQVDVIRSERVAKRVVRALKLHELPQMREQWQDATQGRGDFESWVATLLLNSLDVKPSRESNVIDVTYKSVDPRFAATMANAFAQAYMDTTVDLRVQPARQYSAFFDARGQQLRATLDQARARLTEFQRANGILATDERFDVESARLAELSAHLVSLQSLSAEARSRREQSGTRADAMPEVLANPLLGSLKSDLTRMEGERRGLAERLAANHPKLREVDATIADLKSRIAGETARVNQGVGASDAISRGREAGIRAELEQQRAKVLRMKGLRDEQSRLVREVENAEKAYDGVVARANQTMLESQVTQTNALLLNAAAEPTNASSPRVLLNTLLAVFLGGVLATGSALGVEFVDRRVRLASDVSQALALPVLATLPDAARRRWEGLRRRARSGSPHARRLVESPPQTLPEPPAGAGTAVLPVSVRATDAQAVGEAHNRVIGDILREARQLSDESVRRIVQHQRAHGLRFGESAVALRLVEQGDVLWALSRQFRYPYAPGNGSRLGPELIVARDPFSDLAESLRDLRSSLLPFDEAGRPRRALAIVSPDAGDGKSFLAANLAIAYSQLGQRTLLIDADMRTPRLHQVFGIANNQGLSAALSGRTGSVVTPIPELPNLAVLPVGTVPPNPVELVQHPAFGQMLRDLMARFDHVIVDTPAACHGADYRVIAARCGAALAVVRRGRSRLDAAERLVGSLRKGTAEVVGVLVNEH